MSGAVQQEVEAITERNENESEQRLAEVAAIKEVCVVRAVCRVEVGGPRMTGW